jgi:hypothetical protein
VAIRLAASDVVLAAVVHDDHDWDLYVRDVIWGLPCEDVARLVEGALRRELLEASTIEVADIERGLVRVLRLGEMLLRNGGYYATLREASENGIASRLGRGGDDLAMDNRLLDAFATFFEGWFVGTFRGHKVPTAILNYLLPELCGAVGPIGRTQALGKVLRRLLERSEGLDERDAIKECIDDYIGESGVDKSV